MIAEKKQRNMVENLERVYDFLEDKEYITISRISTELHLKPTSVKNIIHILHKLGKIEFISNGTTSFVKLQNKIKDKENEFARTR